jgi:hypothetical protein
MIDLGVHIERVARRLFGQPNKALSKPGELRFGTHGSLSVVTAGPKAGTWYDHESQIGGGAREMLLANGAASDEAGIADWFKIELGLDVNPNQQHVVRIYDYVDEAGALLFQVLRWGPKKTFSQQQPGPDKGGIKRGPDGKPTMQGARYVPYHLDELVAAKARVNGKPWRVYIPEGEKDVDRLRRQWGLLATCNAGGAGKWRKEYGQHFAGAEVIILADNDDVGRKHAAQVASLLGAFPAIIKIVELGSLAEKGDVSDWIDTGGTQSDLEDQVDSVPLYAPLDVDPLARIVPPGQPEVRSAGRDYGVIPPRQWLLGTNFCLGFLSGLTGAGGTGKTALRILQLIALALDRGDLVEEHVFKRTKALVVCLEDDEAELRRRIRAACLHHEIDESELDGWLYYWTPKDLHLIEVDQFRQIKSGELGDALRRIINHLGIGLVSVDPFVKSHAADENDNSVMDKAASTFLQVAHDCGCAPDYVHHNRKGLTLAGDPESARGASSLINASRLLKTLTKMSEEEAKILGIEKDERRLLIRLDDAKINIAPPSEQAVWFKLVGVEIGNPTEDYPSGDNVQTVERWHPPDAFAGLAITTIADIFDKLRAGPVPGEFYSPDPRANGDWAGWTICELANKEKGDAKRILKTWIKNGVLIEDKYRSPRRRREIDRLTVNEIKAAEMLGSLYRPPGQE